MKTKTISAFLFFISFLFAMKTVALTLKAWERRPHLVVVLVIDQFRADYLTRYESDFLPAKKQNDLGGFRYLMQNGAYFPFAEYPAFQCMTCSGHAMLLTGAPAQSTGIVANEWYDRDEKKIIYCAEDAEGKLSPLRLKTSTVGDELKLSHPKSKTISLALKDRAAIMLAGHKADHVLWFERKSMRWETSSYYGPLPDWATEENSKLAAEQGQAFRWQSTDVDFKTTKLSRDSMAYPLGTRVTLDLAKAALLKENLGHHLDPDILTISLSNHDFLGHQYGFGSAAMKALTLEEDRQISDFLNVLNKHMKGLQDVVIVLTADHGIAPNVEDSAALGLPGQKIDLDQLKTKMEDDLTKAFGKPPGSWIAGQIYFHFYLNPEVLKAKQVRPEEALQVIKKTAQQDRGVLAVFGVDDFQNQKWPQGLLGEQLKAQYNSKISGDLVVIPVPIAMDKDTHHVTHITGYSYDRSVPLILAGASIKAGVHPEFTSVLDLAPTLSFVLGTVAPASSVGHVLPVY